MKAIQIILWIISLALSLACLGAGTMFVIAALSEYQDLQNHGTLFPLFNPGDMFGEEASTFVFALFSVCFLVPGVLSLIATLLYLKRHLRSRVPVDRPAA